MSRKEEILEALGDGFEFDIHFYSNSGKKDLADFIESKAKEVAIGFKKWIDNNYAEPHRGYGYITLDQMRNLSNLNDLPKLTTEELYNIFTINTYNH